MNVICWEHMTFITGHRVRQTVTETITLVYQSSHLMNDTLQAYYNSSWASSRGRVKPDVITLVDTWHPIDRRQDVGVVGWREGQLMCHQTAGCMWRAYFKVNRQRWYITSCCVDDIGLTCPLSYLYFTWQLLMFSQRAHDDGQECERKHGSSAWTRYCQRVRSRLIPYIYWHWHCVCVTWDAGNEWQWLTIS